MNILRKIFFCLNEGYLSEFKNGYQGIPKWVQTGLANLLNLFNFPSIYLKFVS